MTITRKTLLKKLYALEKEFPETDTFCGMEVMEDANFKEPEKHIQIMHDYYGLYTTHDTWKCIAALHKLLNRYSNIEYDTVLSYNATIISFK